MFLQILKLLNSICQHLTSKSFDKLLKTSITFIESKKKGELRNHCQTMPAQIADTIDKVLQPKGVAVVIDANHQCMSTRGVHKTESSTITSRMLGTFRSDNKAREEFISLIHSPKKY